jgi:hypothetical protein
MESAYVDNLEEKIRRKIVRQKRINTIHKLNKVPQRQYIMTSRFNNRTYAEMKAYCQTTRAIKSIYGVPREITHHVSRDSILFVLEMNNETNRIDGIGMVRNQAFPKRHGVYENDTYNMYSYVGKLHIDRDDMDDEEYQFMEIFDILCFKGCRHQKRCQGITRFPIDLLEKFREKLDLTDYISKMFKKRIEQNKT